jgi:hypothetical protein
MNRFLFACASLAFLGCGGPGGEVILEDFQGGAFIIVEMPDAGVSDTTISSLSVGVLDLNGNLLANFNFNNNDIKGLENGAWPTTRGTCVPLRNKIDAALADLNPPETVPDSFLPGNSSCLTFALVHSFSEENQLDNEAIVTLDIKAKNGSQTIKAQIAHTIRIERGVFKGDPNSADETSDLQPSIAILDVVAQ